MDTAAYVFTNTYTILAALSSSRSLVVCWLVHLSVGLSVYSPRVAMSVCVCVCVCLYVPLVRLHDQFKASQKHKL